VSGRIAMRDAWLGADGKAAVAWSQDQSIEGYNLHEIAVAYSADAADWQNPAFVSYDLSCPTGSSRHAHFPKLTRKGATDTALLFVGCQDNTVLKSGIMESVLRP